MTTSNGGTKTDTVGQVASFVQIMSSMLYIGIGSDELHVYLILLDKSWKTGFCWPSDRTIGEWLGGKSQDTASRILKKLENRGLIVRTKVEPSGENHTGRVITVNGRVTPYRKSAARPTANRARTPAANLRHDLKQKEFQVNRPPIPGAGAAAEQTLQEQIADWQTLAKNPCQAIAAMAQRKLDELTVEPKLSLVS